MGLIVIVILISVAMIFVLQFTISKKPASVKSFSNKELAENMLTAMRYTTTECNGLTVSELLKKCAELEQGDCGPPDYDNYCIFVEGQINYLLEQSLEKWNKPYIMSAFIPLSDFNFTSTNPDFSCKGERGAGQQILNTDLGIMTIMLYVCD